MGRARGYCTDTPSRGHTEDVLRAEGGARQGLAKIAQEAQATARGRVHGAGGRPGGALGQGGEGGEGRERGTAT